MALGPKLDLAVTREDLLPRGFHREPLFEDEAVLALARAPGKRLTLMPFLAGPHVAVMASPDRPDPVDTWLATLGRTRRISVVVPHCIMALQLVSGSDLMAVLPRSLVDRFRRGLGLVVHPLPIEVAPFTQFLLHPERMDQDPGNAWLRQALLHLFEAQRPTPRKGRSRKTIWALSPKGPRELKPRRSGR
jgi:DNA-binding transcriptional LysR family regulator